MKKKKVDIQVIKNLLADCLKEQKIKRLFFLDEKFEEKLKKFKIHLPKK